MLSQLLKPPSQQCRCVYIYRYLTANASVAENHHHPTSASTVIYTLQGRRSGLEVSDIHRRQLETIIARQL
jgi:hypothetical protein